MWGMIVSLVQGIVTGVVGPMFTYLGKKQDVEVEGAKAGMTADTANNAAWLDYSYKMSALKLQAVQWWGPRLLYMIVGGAASLHCAAVFLDSMPIGIPYLWTHEVGSWDVVQPPGDYKTYEGWVIASLFVVSIAKGPVSAATSWLHRKG